VTNLLRQTLTWLAVFRGEKRPVAAENATLQAAYAGDGGERLTTAAAAAAAKY